MNDISVVHRAESQDPEFGFWIAVCGVVEQSVLFSHHQFLTAPGNVTCGACLKVLREDVIAEYLAGDYE
jgi:hypothetical protein